MKTKKILLCLGSYLPGTKSAGVITSVVNMCKYLKPDIEFYILTADRDIGEDKPYENVPLEQWTKYEGTNIYYSQKYLTSLPYLQKIMISQNFDAYYLNGFYNISDNFRPMLLYWLKIIPQKPLIIAPRGIFSLGEYDNKLFLRKIYRYLFKISGLNKKVVWSATGGLEREHIIQRFPNANVVELQDLTSLQISQHPVNINKVTGEIKILFISRISEKKNIKFILKTLSRVKGVVTMDFYGMIGTAADKKYWEECLEIIETLPENVKCNYCGTIDRNVVKETFESHHLFFFPTFGENFGHVIAESLAYGCPLLLSDQTPWNMLEDYGAGWNIPLKEPGQYVKHLQQVIDMSQEQWNKMSESALRVAQDFIERDVLINKYNDFFASL